MVRFYNVGRILLAGAFVMSTAFIGGCTKAPAPASPSSKEMSKLEEQRSAAESAEKKLTDLRQERAKLEHDLQEKQAQLQKDKAELQKTSADTAKSPGAPVQGAPVANDTAKAQVAVPPQPDQQPQLVDSTQNKPK